MKSLRERLKAAKTLRARTHETTIIYHVVTDLKDEIPIEIYKSIDEARSCIKGINEEYIKIDGRGIRLFIRPIVVDNDSYEPVTEQNMKYYDMNSEWVKDHIKAMNYEQLQQEFDLGNAMVVKTTAEGTAQLWDLKTETGLEQYVVLADNTVISREEDLNSDPFFPLDDNQAQLFVLTIEERNGEREYTTKQLFRHTGTETIEEAVDKYLQMEWYERHDEEDDEELPEKEDGGFYFDGGGTFVKFIKAEPVTQEEWDVLERFI